MKARNRPEGRHSRTAGGQVPFKYKPRLYRRCNTRHWIAFSVLQARRGAMFPYRTLDRQTGDIHLCGVRHVP